MLPKLSLAITSSKQATLVGIATCRSYSTSGISNCFLVLGHINETSALDAACVTPFTVNR